MDHRRGPARRWRRDRRSSVNRSGRPRAAPQRPGGEMIQPVVIIGGGLSGLTAARALHGAGVAFQLIEARARLGGRIMTVDGFDLGPSWFWPAMQPDFAEHVRGIGAETFAQWETGDLLFQRGQGPAQRHHGLRHEPASMRLAGGMAALTARLAAELPDRCVRLNARATALTLGRNGVTVRIDDGCDLIASHVLIALPPRLAASGIAFDPLLPPAVLRLWRSTPTWMAPHAKVVAVYDRPFWRAAGLSGAARSQVGPLVEVHDASTADGRPALFGFIGVPAQERARAGQPALIAAALRQLGLLFGAAAAEPAATHYKDWAADPLTATPFDLADGTHPTPVRRPWIEGDWNGRLDLIGSETSLDFPGYLAGAHEAALRGTAALVARLDHPPTSQRNAPCA